jgi:hypothetical protein
MGVWDHAKTTTLLTQEQTMSTTQQAEPISRIATNLAIPDILSFSAYDVSCEGNRMLAGPHLIDGYTGVKLRTFKDPISTAGHNKGPFNSDIVAMSCSGNRILLSSVEGLHLFEASKFVRTFKLDNLINKEVEEGFFYPYGKATMNCKGSKILATIPMDADRRNNTVVLLDAVNGTILTTFPTYYAAEAGNGVALAINCAGHKVAVGYPAVEPGGKGVVHLYNDRGRLLKSFSCTECSSLAKFGLTVDLDREGEKLLVTFQSQGQQRRTELIGYDVGSMSSSIGSGDAIQVARLYDTLHGDVLQTFTYDEEETSFDMNTDWQGIISADGTRVMVSSTFKSPITSEDSTFKSPVSSADDQMRSIVYDTESGNIMYFSKEDQILAMDAYINRGIGYGANPSGVYVYSLPASYSQKSIVQDRSSGGGTIASVAAVSLLGAVFIAFLILEQKKKKRRLRDSGTDEEQQGMVEIPFVT